MTHQEIRILAENRILRRKKFYRTFFISLFFNLLMWFVVLENEPEAIVVAFTISGIFCGIMGIYAKKTFGHLDIEKLKSSRRERKIQREMEKIEQEMYYRTEKEYRNEERMRLKEMSLLYRESDFV